MRNEIMDKRI